MHRYNQGGRDGTFPAKLVEEEGRHKLFHRVCRIFSVFLGGDDAVSVQHRWQLIRELPNGLLRVRNKVVYVLVTKAQIAGQPGKVMRFYEKIFLSPQQFLEMVEYMRSQDVYDYARWLVEQGEEINIPSDAYTEEEEVLIQQDFVL